MSPRYFHSCLEKDETNIETSDYNNFNIRWVKRTNSLQKLMPVPRLIMHKKMPVETVWKVDGLKSMYIIKFQVKKKQKKQANKQIMSSATTWFDSHSFFLLILKEVFV